MILNDITYLHPKTDENWMSDGEGKPVSFPKNIHKTWYQKLLIYLNCKKICTYVQSGIFFIMCFFKSLSKSLNTKIFRLLEMFMWTSLTDFPFTYCNMYCSCALIHRNFYLGINFVCDASLKNLRYQYKFTLQIFLRKWLSWPVPRTFKWNYTFSQNFWLSSDHRIELKIYLNKHNIKLTSIRYAKYLKIHVYTKIWITVLCSAKNELGHPFRDLR